MVKSPLALAGLLVVSAALGGGTVLGVQALRGGQGASDKAAIGSIVRDYVLEHPEILPEAMQRLQSRETGKAVASSRSAIFEPYAAAWEGNPQGDVTVAVMMDYACGYCRASLPEIAKLIAEDPKVRVVYRELPVLSEASRVAARWGLAAAEQGKFKPFHTALYSSGGQLDEASIAAAAASAGLDQAKAQATVASPRADAEIAKNLEVASKLGVTGTPSWVIGDRVISGMVPYETLKEAVAAARATRS
ncbi:disulfide bond formation protein DsbA [Sphingomonas turrisvirgatae]|uniref:Disulfide bond formation protein DsbA n=2 Tax=Sphingomonas turrisvirgatae TaxID=1888892 RepID=A0A1E3M1C5_9SPHN|nr:disulfide bond formation protein DsbA [Sphingomonas turrisvirgatae]